MGRYHTIGTGAVNRTQPFARSAASDLVVDEPFEAQTISNFFDSLSLGVLPSGRLRPGGPVLASSTEATEAVREMLVTPADEWAPEPWRATIGHDTLAIRIAKVTGPVDGVEFDPALANITRIPAPVKVMKAKLWESSAPMSDRRWSERCLSKPEMHAVAIQHLSAVIGVFEYLNQPDMRERVRRAYNGVYDVLQEFSAPLNSLRKAGGFGGEVDLAAAWYEYVEDHFSSISQLAHQWVMERVDSLMATSSAMLMAHKPDTGTYPAPPPYDAVQWTLTNRSHDLIELSARAGVAIMLPMEGYNGYVSPQREDIPAVEKNLYVADHEKRLAAFGTIMKTRSRYEHIFVEPDQGLPANHPKTIMSAHDSQRKALDSTKAKMRGEEAQVSLEPWVIRLARFQELRSQAEKDGKRAPSQEHKGSSGFGFFGYRLTHKQSDDEWKEFEKRISDEAHAWATTGRRQDTDGSALDFALGSTISWQDGKRLNIPDNDIEMATKQFHTLASVGSDLPTDDEDLVKRDMFLVVDDDAWDAYLEAKHREEAKKKNIKKAEDENIDATNEGDVEFGAQLAALEANPNQSPELVPFLTPGLSGCPFVTVVDAKYEQPSTSSTTTDGKGSVTSADASRPPSFKGQLRIATHLLFPELYGLTESRSLTLEDFWHLAKRHPRQVYIGPIARSDEGEPPVAEDFGLLGVVFGWLWFGLKAYVCFYVLRYLKRLLLG